MVGLFLTGPSKHSVSKINQLVSLYITFMWGVIVWNTQDNWSIFGWSTVDQAILIFTILAVVGISFGARTYSGDFGHCVHSRTSKIFEKNN